jgi:hypothetical protein
MFTFLFFSWFHINLLSLSSRQLVEASALSEALVTIRQNTWRRVPDDGNLESMSVSIFPLFHSSVFPSHFSLPTFCPASSLCHVVPCARWSFPACRECRFLCRTCLRCRGSWQVSTSGSPWKQQVKNCSYATRMCCSSAANMTVLCLKYLWG